MSSVVMSLLMSVLYFLLYTIFYFGVTQGGVEALNSNIHVLLLGWALIIAGGLSAFGRN